MDPYATPQADLTADNPSDQSVLGAECVRKGCIMSILGFAALPAVQIIGFSLYGSVIFGLLIFIGIPLAIYLCVHGAMQCRCAIVEHDYYSKKNYWYIASMPLLCLLGGPFGVLAALINVCWILPLCIKYYRHHHPRSAQQETEV